jgi:EpsI family protein
VSWPQAANFSDWRPYYMAPDAELRRAYKQNSEAGAGQVALTVLYYRNQNREKSLISSMNRLTGYKDAWHDTTQTRRVETIGGQAVTLRETVLRKDSGGALLVWDWMRIGGHDTTSNVVGKLWQMESKALLRGDDGAAIMLSAPLDENPDAARAALRAFLKDNLPAMNAALAAAHGAGARQ